eukprot:Seg2388.2 transcript_id=Seg2388.2/GoldUCD/mRNA.D3Y31 product="MORN repeat-containing protein 1" protein_id=Seg2388.2/GoldUCD/D3Y31
MKISAKPRYAGETKDQIRDGFGVYNYPNGFFRYEGEWRKGIKHGHGKLVMKDGSFYEGEFKDGEMTGSGVRKWAFTGNLFEGDFLRGELNGKGLMTYGDGSTFEGDWCENMREGEGTLTEADGTVYQGSFHNHKRHGEGLETTRDGQTYEGGWVCDSKQGHGVMKFTDGSIYEGQWRCDMFNGQGSYIHCSGATYEGIWINGKPEVDSTEICIKGEQMIEIEQGQSFEFDICCINQEGETSLESGRMLQVTAGMRSSKSSTGTSSKLSISVGSTGEHLEETLITTPFGFEVEPYHVITNTLVDSLAQPQQQENIQRETATHLPTIDASPDHSHGIGKSLTADETHDDVCPVETEKSNEGTKVKFNEQALASKESTKEITFSYEEAVAPSARVSIGGDGTIENRTQEETQDEILSFTVRTTEGQVSLKDLILPPPAASTNSLLRSSPDSEERASVKGSKKVETASTGSAIHAEKDKKRSRTEQSMNDGEKHRDSKDKEGKKRREKKEEKIVEENKCKPGDYVIIVQDITNPPFLETTLKTAFLHVKVIVPKPKKRLTGRQKTNQML